MIFIILTTIILAICAITDLKGKYIYTWICGISGAGAIITHTLLKDIQIGNVGLGIFIGVIAFIVSILTKEKFGRGDAWMVVAVGAMEGGMYLIPVLVWTFILFNIYAISGVSLKYFNLKSKLPLAPFAFVANILVAILVGGKL